MTPDKDDMKRKMDQHVLFCDVARFAVKGSQAERESVSFLLKNLQMASSGNYRLLVNYNITEKGQGNSLEVDVVVINRQGVFLLEIKDWYGKIEAFDAHWIVNGKERRANAWKSIDYKARVLHSQLFGKDSSFPRLGQVSVTGLVVLKRGRHMFKNSGHDNEQRILALNAHLTEALSTGKLSHRGARSRLLTDADILAITQSLYTRHQPSEVVVHGYRIVDQLALRDLCDRFVAQHTQISTMRVRLKRYQLPSLEQAVMKLNTLHFQRSVETMAALGSHPNLLGTLGFYGDDIHHREDVFYEFTELPTGPGLDEVIQHSIDQGRKMSFKRQISFLKAICLALRLAHNFKDPSGKPAPIYHRNICPETVFQMRDGAIKLGDFDFSKFGDQTISVPGQTLLVKLYTAPELLINSSDASARSDIYALGVLWYVMASLPAGVEQFEPATIDRLDLGDPARALMKRMTAQQPSARPARVEEVLAELEKLPEA
jgi:serine/threonine protein kinase